VGDAEIERPQRSGLSAAHDRRREVAERAMEQAADMPEPRVARRMRPGGLDQLQRRFLAAGVERGHAGAIGGVGVGGIDHVS
jgi:hypothetical protein